MLNRSPRKLHKARYVNAILNEDDNFCLVMATLMLASAFLFMVFLYHS